MDELANQMMRSIVLDENRLGLVCCRAAGQHAASIRRKLEGNDDTEEPLEEEDELQPDDDPLELTTISMSRKTDAPASGLWANGGSRSVGAVERVAQALGDDDRPQHPHGKTGRGLLWRWHTARVLMGPTAHRPGYAPAQASYLSNRAIAS